jgi:hypothetical protein
VDDERQLLDDDTEALVAELLEEVGTLDLWADE